MTKLVVACVDGSAFSTGVADHAAWAARQLDTPLTLLHFLDHAHAIGPTDLSGTIGLGAQESLLHELADLDAQVGRVAMARGRVVLAAARERVMARGVAEPVSRQLHGNVVDNLVEMADEIRLLVLGKRGTTAHLSTDHLGSNLERVIRAMHCPTLVVPPAFSTPTKVLIAFDGSETIRKGVQMVAGSALLAGTTLTVAQVGEPDAAHRAAQDEAVATLRAAGLDAHGVVVPGHIDTALHAYQIAEGCDLLVMGVYGHSRIRHLLVGSTTTAMIRATDVPLLLLR